MKCSLSQQRGETTKAAPVTGTSSGIGLCAATEPAKADFSVTATMRDPTKGEKLVAKAKEGDVMLGLLHSTCKMMRPCNGQLKQ
jgi:NAD(P)-dependent dehydrogenase (short-subunit alcohol dehydrogenase family)